MTKNKSFKISGDNLTEKEELIESVLRKLYIGHGSEAKISIKELHQELEAFDEKISLEEVEKLVKDLSQKKVIITQNSPQN